MFAVGLGTMGFFNGHHMQWINFLNTLSLGIDDNNFSRCDRRKIRVGNFHT